MSIRSKIQRLASELSSDYSPIIFDHIVSNENTQLHFSISWWPLRSGGFLRRKKNTAKRLAKYSYSKWIFLILLIMFRIKLIAYQIIIIFSTNKISHEWYPPSFPARRNSGWEHIGQALPWVSSVAHSASFHVLQIASGQSAIRFLFQRILSK